MNNHTLGAFGLVFSLSCVSAGSNAALISQLGGQAVYDSDRNITWLANANLAATETFGVSGINFTGHMTFAQAHDWIAGMNAANYLGFSNWRLPNVLQPDPTCSGQYTSGSAGFNCTGGELGHLYYEELGGQADEYLSTTHNSNFDLFQNIGNLYTYAQADSLASWDFIFNSTSNGGWQGRAALGSNAFLAWAVHDGNIGATVVPLPAAFWLFGSGLLGLIGFAKRKAA